MITGGCHKLPAFLKLATPYYIYITLLYSYTVGCHYFYVGRQIFRDGYLNG